MSSESMLDGLGAVKGERGGLDQGTKGQRMDHGQLTLGDVDKQMYMLLTITNTYFDHQHSTQKHDKVR